jgi:hypothetical protein
MSYAIGWAARTAAVLGFAAAFAALSPGAAADARTPDIRLAQAAPSATAAPAAGDAQNEREAADLHKKLHITPAQRPLFDAVVKVMQQNTQEMEALMQQNPPGRHRNALDELRTQAQAAQTEAAGLQRLLPAFQALYESLSEAQKSAADHVFAAPPEAPPDKR